VPTHFEEEYRQREREADREAPGHIDQFRARAAVEAHLGRFERHAADRAGAGVILPHFGMHGAGPDRSRRRFDWCLRGQILLGIRDELGSALGAAEMVLAAGMGHVVRARRRIDLHAAYGIEENALHFAFRAALALRVMAVRMIMGHFASLP
jgi:hypothetical protein